MLLWSLTGISAEKLQSKDTDDVMIKFSLSDAGFIPQSAVNILFIYFSIPFLVEDKERFIQHN